MCTKAVAVNVRKLSSRVQSALPETMDSEVGLAEKSDVLPTDLAPVITHERPREIQRMRWGLIPHYTRDLSALPSLFNARAETLLQLPSFRDLVMTRRCLILNYGFYEFEVQGDERVQWKMRPVGEELFYKAGLWTTWRNPQTGELVNSFTMITCAPGTAKISRIHDRMPVILNRQERRLWMNPQASQAQLMALLKPCADDLYRIEEYSRKAIKGAKSKKGRPIKPGEAGSFF